MPRKKCEIFLNFSSTKTGLSHHTQHNSQPKSTPLHMQPPRPCVSSIFFFLILFFFGKKMENIFLLFHIGARREKEAKKICVKFDIEKKLCVVGEHSCHFSLSHPPPLNSQIFSTEKRESEYESLWTSVSHTHTITITRRPKAAFFQEWCEGCVNNSM